MFKILFITKNCMCLSCGQYLIDDVYKYEKNFENNRFGGSPAHVGFCNECL